MCQSPSFMKLGLNVVFEKKYLTRALFFFLSVTIDVEVMKITLKVGAPVILSNISTITRDTVFCLNRHSNFQRRI